MNPFEFCLAVVAIVIVGKVLRDHFRHQAEGRAQAPSDDTRLLVEEVARLRDRVQVLERVITDNHGSIDLDRRIEQLRDR